MSKDADVACPHEPSNRIAPIAEGICPRCDQLLDRRDDAGWCSCCGLGWSLTSDSVSLHFEVDLGGGGVG